VYFSTTDTFLHILLVTPYYAPDLGPSAPLVTMLCEDLVKMGHQVTVLAAVPHFPSGRVSPEYRQRAWYKETYNGVLVYRVWVPDGDRAILPHRLLTFIIYQLITSFIGLSLSYDVVIISNPAIETGLPFVFLSWLRRKPTLLFVWDVYPDVGVHLGVFKHPAIIALVKATEDFFLLRSGAVHVLSENFINVLAARGVERSKFVVIPPWLDTEFIHPLPRQNSFSEEFNLVRYFVVLYAGNLGMSQGLDKILLTAKALSSHTDILFVFVGDGANRESLVSQVETLQIENVKFIPFQPRERLPEVLASADIALVSLQSGLENDSLPSKTFPILASGRPIVAVMDKDNALAGLIELSKAGKCVPPADIDALAKVILFLKSAPDVCQEMSKNAREYVLRNHSRFSVVNKFNEVLQRIQEKAT
jgi:colanic acid biosynthesis glycosyl transferase WcaI